MILNIKNELLKNGGFTLNSKGNKISVKSGFVVAGFSKVHKLHISSNLKDFNVIVNKLLKNAKKQGLNVGGWLYNDIAYLELSKIYKSKKEAIIQALKTKEIAIYDLKNNKDIIVKVGE